MKKLLFVISQLYKGGAETALVNLLNNMDYSAYEIELLILDQRVEGNVVSLIDRVNSKVKICDAYKEYERITLLDRIRAKLEYSMEQKGAFWFPALDFVKDKVYDWAFFWGEWCAPTFVAYYVTARKKAAWIHTDISEAKFFNPELYFYFFDYFDKFIFVSQKSMNTALEKYPFIRGKEALIYNISDANAINKQALEPLDDYKRPEDKKVIVTCANIRPEKNHFRQVSVLAELKRRGFSVQWLNIGSTTNTELVAKLKQKCVEEGIEDDFLFLGVKNNPYKYMKKADFVAVLSDFESWSMVITEAKILGIPVIATKTSGALEQIVDGETGILTGYSPMEIADKITTYFENEDKVDKIKNKIRQFDNTPNIIEEFELFLNTESSDKERKNTLLYIIDDINYFGGAHTATINQIRELQLENKWNISIFSMSVPNCEVRQKLPGVRFFSWRDEWSYKIFNGELLNILYGNEFSFAEKKERCKCFYKKLLNKRYDVLGNEILPRMSHFFSKFEIVCVMSEGSIFRKAVAESMCKKKIQWIHTDYCAWRMTSEWTQNITRNDEKIYQNMDVIVTLSEKIKKTMSVLYPTIEDKIVVNKNIIPVDEIKKKSQAILKNKKAVNFITVGRLDNSAKACRRLLEILLELAEEGYLFKWVFVGDGEEFAYMNQLVNNSILKNYVVLKGAMKNPFIEVKKADVFALLSSYEGVPNTIYEALILGVPVLATDVGAISDQIIDKETGWLVPNEKVAIKSRIEYILMNPEEISIIKNNVEKYSYDNAHVMEINNEIFGL